ncbi:TlpA family protein disulfide reductase [Ilumatobacter nonamiensis]|uniref:TlpA family protein disulfide reductase n=1 Tax=Ilumatobacter nonamiensis TaxID=467093 RepID=UPI0003485167|nr:TlpA disulfide reductase family protein [Ilumatobacter nonamiensis]
MKIERPRLLVGSLLAAVLVIGGFVVWQLSADSEAGDDGVDAVLEDPQDRALPDDEFAIDPVPDLDGDAFPEATLLDAAGNEVSSTSWLGDTPLVINFWFSTCIPCERELADFAEVDAETGEEVRFIGVNPLDTVPVMERFAGERGVEYDLMRDEWVELQTGLGVAAFPYTVFVTSEGEIVGQTGVLDADGLRTEVDALLEAENRA